MTGMVFKFENMVMKKRYLKRMIKGKAVPFQAWSGPEGSMKFRFPDFMTTAQDWW
jgi:hypothetical protein